MGAWIFPLWFCHTLFWGPQRQHKKQKKKAEAKQKRNSRQNSCRCFCLCCPSSRNVAEEFFFPASFIFFHVFVFLLPQKQNYFLFPKPRTFFLFSTCLLYFSCSRSNRWTQWEQVLSFHVLTVCFFAKRVFFYFFVRKPNIFLHN